LIADAADINHYQVGALVGKVAAQMSDHSVIPEACRACDIFGRRQRLLMTLAGVSMIAPAGTSS
jgi:hypothetical protein